MASKVVVMHDTLDNAANQPSMQTMCSCWEPEQSYMEGLLMDGSTLFFHSFLQSASMSSESHRILR